MGAWRDSRVGGSYNGESWVLGMLEVSGNGGGRVDKKARDFWNPWRDLAGRVIFN
jgi:hypothetical protein